MKITCGNITKDIEKGATVMQCLRALDADMSGVMAVQQGGRELELTDETYAAWLADMQAAGSGELAALFAQAE